MTAPHEEAVRADLTDIKDWVSELTSLRAEKDDLEERIKKAEQVIKDMIGDECTDGMVDGKLAVTWRWSERTTLDTKKIRAALPAEVLKPFEATTRVRTFKVVTP